MATFNESKAEDTDDNSVLILAVRTPEPPRRQIEELKTILEQESTPKLAETHGFEPSLKFRLALDQALQVANKPS